MGVPNQIIRAPTKLGAVPFGFLFKSIPNPSQMEGQRSHPFGEVLAFRSKARTRTSVCLSLPGRKKHIFPLVVDSLKTLKLTGQNDKTSFQRGLIGSPPPLPALGTLVPSDPYPAPQRKKLDEARRTEAFPSRSGPLSLIDYAPLKRSLILGAEATPHLF